MTVEYKDYGYRIDCYRNGVWCGIIWTEEPDCAHADPCSFQYAFNPKRREKQRKFESVHVCKDWIERWPK